MVVCKYDNIFSLVIVLAITGFNVRSSIGEARTEGLYIPTKISDDVCRTAACNSTAAEIIKNMDNSVDPCDNFYKFVCGNFVKRTNIPNDKKSIGVFDKTWDKIGQQLRRSLEEPSSLNESKPYRLAKNFYKSCMDKLGIEKRGKEFLNKILKDLGGWPVLEGPQWNQTDFHWTDAVYKFRKVGYPIDNFFSINVGIDLKNSSKTALQFREPTMILSRDYLTSGTNNTIVKAYYKYMIDIAVKLGAPRNNVTKKELFEVLKFEIALAEITPSDMELTNMTQLDNPMTIAELSMTYPSIPWKKYINNILEPYSTVDDNEVIIVLVPEFIPKFIKLMNTTSKRVQANYAMWRAAAYSIPFLTKDMLRSFMKFSTKYYGITKLPSRWEKCVDHSTSYLGTHALYVKKYFGETAKNTTIQTVIDIRNELNKVLQTIDWMDEDTRKNALEKQEATSFFVGYPDELVNEQKLEELYKNLEFNDESFLDNQLKLDRFELDRRLRKFGKPYNKNDWVDCGFVAIVNTFYSPQTNSIQIPAGILQGLFFSDNRPKYMNYGAIGSLISHEFTHGFDSVGRQFDKYGNLKNWWTSLTNERFLNKSQCIIDQYKNYTVEEIGEKLNSKHTIQEDISDNGGINIAYSAYKNWSEKHEKEQSLAGLPFSPQQMYWISAATIWCSKVRPEYFADWVINDAHSPNEFRIIGSFSNSPEFAKDFNCPLGSRMNPKNKCRFW